MKLIIELPDNILDLSGSLDNLFHIKGTVEEALNTAIVNQLLPKFEDMDIKVNKKEITKRLTERMIDRLVDKMED